jgi:polar amino acid transport system substrate-binding protein
VTRGLFAVVVCALAAGPAAAQAPPLRWGGDKNGGAPYIFEDAAGKLVGFEVEFAEYIGKELGREPVFVQNQWDNLPLSLARGEHDIVLNGYEYSAERHAATPTTVPYYVYSLRLIVTTDEEKVLSWAELGRQEKKRPTVGVLRGTASERYLEGRYGDTIELVRSETVTEMLDQVQAKKFTATVQDAPAASYYVSQGRFPGLKVVDDPVGYGYYVILTKQGDDALRERLNEAIRKGIRTGALRELYQKYHLWNAAQQRLSYLSEQPWPAVADELSVEEGGGVVVTKRLRDILDKLALAAGTTLLLAFTSFPLAMLLGVLVALGRVYGPSWVRVPLGVYVEVLRGTPLLLQLFVIYYLPTQLGRIDGLEWVGALAPGIWTAAILGLAVNYSAAEAENYRAGLLAVPRGQLEAALALGMSPAVAVRHVVLPQAFRIVIPPVTNDFIALFKDTAVCSTIMIVELTGLYYQYKIYPSLVLELAVAVGLLYLMMSYPMAVLARWAEAKIGHGGAR